MKIKIKNVNQCEKEMIVTIDTETAKNDYLEVLKKFKNYVQLPGFRKGKAPLQKIEAIYAESVKEEFFNQKLETYYKAALDKKKINPINVAEPTNIEWEKGKDLIATFKYEIMPEIDIQKYKNLDVPFEPAKFKKDMVDATLTDYQNKMATEKDVEIAAKGDIVNATVKFIGNDGTITKEIERTFAVGDNPYSKSFNTAVTGKKVGAEFKAKLFTKTQKSDDSEIGEKFKDREFMIVVKSIKRKELPKLDDEFAKDLEYDSMEKLREKVSEQLKIKIKNDNAEYMRTAIISKIIEENEFDVPNSMVKNYAEEMAKPYAEQYKMEVDKIAPMYMEMAKFSIKQHYILADIKQKEKIEATKADTEKLVQEAADNMKMKIDEYKKMYKKQIEGGDFKLTAEERKLIAFLKENVKFIPYPKEKKEK